MKNGPNRIVEILIDISEKLVGFYNWKSKSCDRVALTTTEWTEQLYLWIVYFAPFSRVLMVIYPSYPFSMNTGYTYRQQQQLEQSRQLFA